MIHDTLLRVIDLVMNVTFESMSCSVDLLFLFLLILMFISLSNFILSIHNEILYLGGRTNG